MTQFVLRIAGETLAIVAIFALCFAFAHTCTKTLSDTIPHNPAPAAHDI